MLDKAENTNCLARDSWENRIQIGFFGQFEPELVAKYWQSLIDANTLKFRLCDVVNPTKLDIRRMLLRKDIQSYYIWDKIDNKITAEFMLENFSGMAAQIHFSMNPENESPYSVNIATTASDDVLNTWNVKDTDKPFLKTLYGLTPMTNRVARLFNVRVGFKKVGIIPNAMRDRGKVVDAMLVIKTRKT